MRNIRDLQTHRWVPDIGDNLEQPEDKQFWFLVREQSVEDTLSLQHLVSTGLTSEAHADLRKMLRTSIVEIHGLSYTDSDGKEVPLEDPDVLVRLMGLGLFAKLITFLQNPVRHDSKN
jgi:hypothetical protein